MQDKDDGSAVTAIAITLDENGRCSHCGMNGVGEPAQRVWCKQRRRGHSPLGEIKEVKGT